MGLHALVAQCLADAVGDAPELALRLARADDEVVGQRRQATDLEQHDVRRLLVRREIDDAPREGERLLVGLGARRGGLARRLRRPGQARLGAVVGSSHKGGCPRYSFPRPQERDSESTCPPPLLARMAVDEWPRWVVVYAGRSEPRAPENDGRSTPC